MGGPTRSGGAGAVACSSVDGERLWRDDFRGEGYGDVAIGLPDRVAQADRGA